MLRVTAPGYRTIAGPFEISRAGVLRQDLRLADSTAARGAARFAGRVVHENGKPVTPARAVVTALGLDTPVRDGAFAFTELPPGTWVVEVRSIGLEPRSVLIDATEGATASATIAMNDRSQALEAVTVVGKPGRESKVLDDLLRRKRYGAGTVFLPGNIYLLSADRVQDVLRAARGFSSKGDGGYYGRAVRSCYVDENNRKQCTLKCDRIRVYLNGERVSDGLQAIDNRVTVREVLGIEAYPDIAFAPPEWRFSVGDQACAVVGIWTRLP